MKPTDDYKRGIIRSLQEVLDAQEVITPHKKLLPRPIDIEFYNPLFERRMFVRVEEKSLSEYEVTVFSRPKRGKAVRVEKPQTFDSLDAAMERAKNYSITWGTTND